jgi:uncharacterized protein YfaS (alpha-2-macroglobulin family)
MRPAIVRLSSLLALTLLALLPAACSRDAGTPEPAPGTTRSGAEAATHYIAPPGSRGFHVMELQGFNRYGRPAVRVRFPEALAPSQDFDKLLDLRNDADARPVGSWEIEDDNTTLVFPYLEPDKRYRLTVKAELASAAGDTLGQAFEHTVYSGPQSPMLGFASQGHVLPGRDSAGLPVITINVTEADIEFLRVRERALPRFLADYQRNGERSAWELRDITDMADSVYSSRFALRADANQRTLNHIPVRDLRELSQPGAYFAIMRGASRFDDSYETALFFVSDLGVHARLHKDGTFVHVASLASGEAVSGVTVELLDRHGKTLAEAATDRDGNAALALRASRNDLLVARKGNDFSLLSLRTPALDLSAFGLGGRVGGSERSVFLWGGRDLFRPGEAIRVQGLLRDHDGRAVTASPLFLRLLQPNGRVYARAQATPDALGWFRFERELPADVATGRWNLEVRLDPDGQAVGAMALRIEEFLPERLKLELASGDEALPAGAPLPLKVEAAYLYGAPAAGNRFMAEVSFERAGEIVKTLPGFRFGDPTVTLPKMEEPAIDTALPAEGRLDTEIELPDDLPTTSPLSVFVRGSVFEPGGRAVSRTIKRVVWPNETLVGIRPLFDAREPASANAPAQFEIARTDSHGNLAAGAVEVALMRDRHDYIWTHDPELGWKAEFVSNWEAVGPAQTLQLDGRSPVRYEARVEWGDYRVDITDPATGLVTRLPFVAGWSSNDSNQGDAARPDKVKVALDRSGYRAGDTARLTLTPPQPGPGLLLVEAGDRLLHSRRIDVKNGTVVDIDIPAEWERHDIYLTAIVFRPGSAREKITPNRAIGITHLPIERGDRRIALTLQAPERMRPGNTLDISVEAPSLAGRTAMISLSAVDQGIINITRYPVPDAADYFFAARRYVVDAYDLYGKVIEYRDGHGATLRYGGDLALDALPQARRPTAKVATVDLFTGPVKIGVDGKAMLAIDVPDFNGRLRLAAVVWTEDRFGSAEGATEVRAPLVAEISSPRVMAPGDRSQVTLDLHNLSGKAQTFDLEISAGPPLRVEDGRRQVRLADDERTVLSVPLHAMAGQDVGRLRVQVRGDGVDLDRRVELVVRPGWGTLRSSRMDELPGGSSIQLGAGELGAYLPGSGALSLSVSRQPPVPFSSALEYLIGYPYGCLEQTTSRAFPLALLDAGTAQRLGLASLDEDKRRTTLDEALSRISAMQMPSGHFSMWGGEGQAQTQLTPFVAEMLIEARDAGQAIPEPVLERALERLNEDLLSGGDRYYAYENSESLRFAIRAHAGYVLARLGRAPLGTLRAMKDNEAKQARSLLSLVHLGLALHLQGDQPRGMETLSRAFANPPRRPRWLGDYGSNLRDRALALALLRQHDVRVAGIDSELLGLARSLGGGSEGSRRYFTTQEQLALFRLGRQLRRDGADPVGGRLRIGGDSEDIAATAMFARTFGDDALSAGVQFDPAGSGSLYVVRESVGVPRSPPAAADDGVSIRRDWFTTSGDAFTGNTVREGESLVVRLTIEARERSDDLLVVDYLPGGLEAENLNLVDRRLLESLVIDGMPMNERYGVDIRNEEYRDDRYVAALRMWQGQTAQLYYLVRAVSPGEYVVPPPQAEDMYRPDIRSVGQSRPQRITVTPP